jgi:tRNA-Thr(GGU) m(6)t(6)A37 methyltransferase TsaA
VATSRPSSVTFDPIGVVRSPFHERSQAPRQPAAAGAAAGRVELLPGRGLEDALSDIEHWDYLWLIVWFHHNKGFRPKVLPPRSTRKRGVFATRAPYRPNPIGISAVRLERVEGLTLHVKNLDLLDGTPVLDIKPYVPYTDSIPHASHGWLDVDERVNVAQPADPRASYEVTAAEPALTQLAYLRDEHQIDLWPRIAEALALGPTPHAYRRIKELADGYVLSLKDWRIRFTAVDRAITVERLATGYKTKALPEAPAPHRAFADRFPR